MSDLSHRQMAWQSNNNELVNLTKKAILYSLEVLPQNMFWEPENGSENIHHNIWV